MKSGRPRVGLLAAALVLGLAGASCSPPGRSPDREGASADPQALEPGIVRAVDLLRVPGLQPMQRLTDSEIPSEMGPNVRGGCGAEIEQPPASNRLVAVFLGDTAALTEAIVETGEPKARELIDQIREDIRPGCEPQTSETATGESQTYVQGPVVDIGRLGEDRLASLATLEFDDGELYIGTVLIRAGDLMIQALYSSETDFDAETLQGLAEVMYTAFEELRESV